jgi:DNA-directed RNA polymerase specialized sigma24 family protein
VHDVQAFGARVVHPERVMSRTCTICKDPRRKVIERAFLAGYTYRHIGSRFDITTTSLQRHVKHIARSLMMAQRSRDVQRGRELLDVAAEALVEARKLMQTAKGTGELKAWAEAIKALQRHVEILGKLQRPEQPLIVLMASPAWKQVEDAIFKALTPHTKARNDVARALMGITTVDVPALPAATTKARNEDG